MLQNFCCSFFCTYLLYNCFRQGFLNLISNLCDMVKSQQLRWWKCTCDLILFHEDKSGEIINMHCIYSRSSEINCLKIKSLKHSHTYSTVQYMITDYSIVLLTERYYYTRIRVTYIVTLLQSSQGSNLKLQNLGQWG